MRTVAATVHGKWPTDHRGRMSMYACMSTYSDVFQTVDLSVLGRAPFLNPPVPSDPYQSSVTRELTCDQNPIMDLG